MNHGGHAAREQVQERLADADRINSGDQKSSANIRIVAAPASYPTIPSGSGHPAHSAFGPFIKALLEIVRLHRNERATLFEIRSRERQQRQLGEVLDKSRVDMERSRAKGRTRKSVHHISQLRDTINRSRETFRDNNTQLERRRTRLEWLRKDIRIQTTRLYDLGAEVCNDVFRPDGPPLSPLFWGRLQRARAGLFLLQGDEQQAAVTHMRTQRTLAALREASLAVTDHIKAVENQEGGSKKALATAMRALDVIIRDRVAKLRIEQHAAATLAVRNENQRRLESNLFLNIAGRILESEDLIERDRLRTSLTEDEESGEPSILSGSPHRLTKPQLKKIQQRFAKALQSTDRCEAILESLETRFQQDLVQFRRCLPGSSIADFDDINVQDNIQAKEQLHEAQEEETWARNEIFKFDLVPREKDFLDEPHDGNTQSEAPMKQQARMLGTDHAIVDSWRRNPEQAHAFAEPSKADTGSLDISDWRARSVEVQDPDRYSDVSLPGGERSMRTRLLLRLEEDRQDIRSGMSISSHSNESSEPGTWWCC